VLAGAAARTLPRAPTAYRIGNTLVLQVAPFSDNTPGHSGPEGSRLPGETGRYAVYENGAEIAHGDPFTPAGPNSSGGLASGAGVPVGLTARPSTIRLVLTAARKVTPPLSESSTTVWTWRSRRDPGARVPAGWFCQAKIFGKLVRDCAVQPMLALDYHVRGLALDGSTAPGPQLIGLDVTHIQPGGQSRTSGATVHVSVDGGRTWRLARVTADGGGRFAVRFTQPPGRDVTLRVAARDASGGTITETLRDAYRVRRAGAALSVAGARLLRPAPRPACPTARPGHASCYVIYQPRRVTPSAGRAGWAGPALASTHPTGLGATQLEQACSAYVAKPAWQHDAHCAGRTVADVSAAASDISIYNPVYGGWLNVDGTSAAAPLVAGVYGLAGNAATIPLGYAYAHRSDLFDITQGTNSGFATPRQACGDDYLCVAKPGYDAPTGLGTPNGTGAF
jgi:hypothetical protein